MAALCGGGCGTDDTGNPQEPSGEVDNFDTATYGDGLTFADENLALSSKRGVVLLDSGITAAMAKAVLKAGWYSNRAVASSAGDEIEFIPTINNAAEVESLAASGKVMGLYQPELTDLSPEASMAMWQPLMMLSLPLGSPAVIDANDGCSYLETYGSQRWLDNFMSLVEAKNYRVDYLCIQHLTTTTDVDELKKKVESVHSRYPDYPIIITEMALLNDEESSYTEEDVLTLMGGTLNWLDKQEYVVGYAWSSLPESDAKGGVSALVDGDGNVTKAGEYFASRDEALLPDFVDPVEADGYDIDAYLEEKEYTNLLNEGGFGSAYTWTLSEGAALTSASDYSSMLMMKGAQVTATSEPFAARRGIDFLIGFAGRVEGEGSLVMKLVDQAENVLFATDAINSSIDTYAYSGKITMSDSQSAVHAVIELKSTDGECVAYADDAYIVLAGGSVTEDFTIDAEMAAASYPDGVNSDSEFQKYNLLKDPGFEEWGAEGGKNTGSANWGPESVATPGATAVTGATAKIQNTSLIWNGSKYIAQLSGQTYSNIQQIIDVEPNTYYKVGFYGSVRGASYGTMPGASSLQANIKDPVANTGYAVTNRSSAITKSPLKQHYSMLFYSGEYTKVRLVIVSAAKTTSAVPNKSLVDDAYFVKAEYFYTHGGQGAPVAPVEDDDFELDISTTVLSNSNFDGSAEGWELSEGASYTPIYGQATNGMLKFVDGGSSATATFTTNKDNEGYMFGYLARIVGSQGSVSMDILDSEGVSVLKSPLTFNECGVNEYLWNSFVEIEKQGTYTVKVTKAGSNFSSTAYVDSIYVIQTDTDDKGIIHHYGVNIVTNGDFQSGLNGWACNSNSAHETNVDKAITGGKSIRLTGKTAESNFSQNIKLDAGKTYRLTFKARIQTADGVEGAGVDHDYHINGLIRKSSSPEATQYIQLSTTSNMNTELTGTFTMAEDVDKAQLYFYKDQNIAYVDDIVVEEIDPNAVD